MQVEISADTPISEQHWNECAEEVRNKLTRFSEKLTRVEVHLKNLQATGAGVQTECRLEARPAGRDPVAVTHNAATMMEALTGAVGKVDRLLDSYFGKMESARRGPSASGQTTP